MIERGNQRACLGQTKAPAHVGLGEGLVGELWALGW